jgi:hypothetical protein
VTMYTIRIASICVGIQQIGQAILERDPGLPIQH